jgi:PAS domain S-box-containing protein
VINDISAQVQAEAALRESEARYRSLFENMHEGFALQEIIQDENGRVVDFRIVDANSAYEQHTGKKPGEIVGHTLRDVTPNADPAMIERYGEVALAGKPMDFEYYSKTFHRHIRVRSFRPQPNQFASIFEDVTERKQAQIDLQAAHDVLEQRVAERTAELKQSEDKFSKAFYDAPVARAIIRESDRVITDVNQYFTKLFEYSREEIVGHTAFELGIVPSPAHSAEVDRILLEEQRDLKDYEAPILLRSGKQIDLLTSTASINLADGTYHLFTFVDITERKQAEEKFSRAFYESPVARALVREAGRIIVDVNDRFVEMFEYSRGQVIGRTPLELGLDPGPASLAEITRVLMEERRDLTNYEMSVVLQSGKRVDMLFSTAAINLADGRYHLFALVDITKRKRAEEKLAETNSALEKALRVKDEFMAAMSHELRTPLTGILGMAEVLQIPNYGELSEKQRKAIGVIETNGNRLLDVINGVLDYSKLQNGGVTVYPKRYDLAHICQAALLTIGPATARKRQQTHFSTEPEPITLATDRQLLLQLLKYLLENASKFTATAGEFGIEVLGSREEKLVRLSVWDNGIGIQEQDLPRLFQPFVQLDARLARQYEGAGLGLVLVRQIAELLGGRVSVESVFGKGSRFTVSLPWSD